MKEKKKEEEDGLLSSPRSVSGETVISGLVCGPGWLVRNCSVLKMREKKIFGDKYEKREVLDV